MNEDGRREREGQRKQSGKEKMDVNRELERAVETTISASGMSA